MARKIQFKRGNEADLPQLDVAELGFTTDSEKLFIGGTAANVELAKRTDVEEVSRRLDDYTGDVDGGVFGDTTTGVEIDGGVF